MAVYVDISDTRHLAYSPLNEKHNILYHRARQNVNQRHLHKPCFSLNPFLDNAGQRDLSLDDYKPENEQEIVPLQSLVIVEDYFDDNPHFVKEFQIGEFWEFLFSESWRQGYSVRVLEGQLQELLLSTLVKLTSAGQATHHSTVAYAKNRKQRLPIYKRSEKKLEPYLYEETLLLEFVYYGHVRKQPSSPLPDYSSFGYPEATTCSTTTNASSDLESSDKEYLSPRSEEHLVQPPTTPQKFADQRRQRLLRRRVRTHNSTLALIHEDETTDIQVEGQIPNAAVTHDAWQPDTRSGFSMVSDDYKAVPSSIDLSKFRCTEKVSYLGEFDLCDDSSSSEDEDSVQDFGQEYYLGELGKMFNPDVTDSVETRLRRRKEIMSRERAMRRQQLEQVKHRPVRKVMPEFSELDVKKYLKESEMHVLRENEQQVKESVPDLPQYITMLKEQERNDIRYRNKVKLRIQEMKRRYTQVDPRNQMIADTVGGVTGSHACRVHCYSKLDVAWRFKTEKAKRAFLIEKLHGSGGKTGTESKPRTVVTWKLTQKQEIPLIYITTNYGITYLHPVSRKMLEARQDKRKADKKKMPRRRKCLVQSPIKLREEKLKSERDAKVSSIESPDEDSDIEGDGLEDSLFNTKKLNLKYSLEKIRAVKAKRNKKKDILKETFFGALRKYYRMRKVLKAFGKDKKGSKLGFALPKKKLDKVLTKEPERKPITIGKLREFSFLKTKKTTDRLSDISSKPLFPRYSMDIFHEFVEKALDQFVVRKEIVISDYNAKASVSITFTKKSIFTNPKMCKP